MEKGRPQWQSGFWNGVGGRVEGYDLSYSKAMEREWFEEVRMPGDSPAFKRFVTIEGLDYTLHCFYAFSDQIYNAVGTDEPVAPWSIEHLPVKLIPNNNWIIPMALNHSQDEIRKDYLMFELQ